MTMRMAAWRASILMRISFVWRTSKHPIRVRRGERGWSKSTRQWWSRSRAFRESRRASKPRSKQSTKASRRKRN